MDWRNVNFDWNRARAFLVTAEEGSFSAAGRALGISQPTVGRQVAALEEELGVSLIERVGRGVEVTPAGLALVEHVRAMGEAANRIGLVAAGRSVSLAGVVTVSASEMVSVHLLPPLIAACREQYPEIHIDIVASMDASDLRRREADIAVRNFRPEDPELVAKKVREGKARLYGSESYLARVGPLTADADLTGVEFIGFDRTDTLIEGLRSIGLDLGQDNFPLTCMSQPVQWALVRSGLGVGMMMEEVGDSDPTVRRVFEDVPAWPVPYWLTSHREVRMSARVRAVFDVLAVGLRFAS